jgi:hypothetical protein
MKSSKITSLNPYVTSINQRYVTAKDYNNLYDDVHGLNPADNTLSADVANHLDVKTILDTKTIRLNSRDFTATSGDVIGFQSKPNGTGLGTTTVYGGQISPRLADTVTATGLVGLSVEPILKGASVAAVSGDYRALDVKLSADGTNAGHTVGGVTAGIIFYNTLKTGLTTTGGVYPFVITANGDTKQWSGAFKIADTAGLTQASAAGATAHYIKVMVGSTVCTILASSA